MTSVVAPVDRAPPVSHLAQGPAESVGTVQLAFHPWIALVTGGSLVAVLLSRWNAPAILVTIGLAITLVVRLAVRGRIDRIGWIVIVYLGALTSYGIAVGSAPTIDGVIRFLSFEGRPFVAYLPALVIATATVTRGDLAVVRWFMRWSVVFGGVLLALWLLVGAGLGDRANFEGLASSHHAIGFFFSIAALVLLVPREGERRLIDTALGLTALGIVVASGSRTSMVGLLVACIYLVISAPSLRRKIRLVALIVSAATLALVLSGKFVQTVEFLSSSAFLQAASIEFSRGDVPEAGKELESASRPGSVVANVLIRFGVWRTSVDAFAQSPLVGIGPWRLNDGARAETGIPGLVMLATEGERVSGSGFGAHNLFLQTLAETGIIGLALLAAPWIVLLARLRRQGLPGRPAIALIAFGAGTILTSNAMISPALCFPLLVYGMIAARLPADPEQD